MLKINSCKLYGALIFFIYYVKEDNSNIFLNFEDYNSWELVLMITDSTCMKHSIGDIDTKLIFKLKVLYQYEVGNRRNNKLGFHIETSIIFSYINMTSYYTYDLPIKYEQALDLDD